MPNAGRYDCPKRNCDGRLEYQGRDPNDYKYRCRECGKIVRFEAETAEFNPRNIDIPGL
jgi:RNase P subunit RPR2